VRAQVAKLFVKDTARFPSDKDVTRASGISALLPGSAIQEFCFEPCGYSMNGLLFDAYWTIHITPESHCSYASFETNVRVREYATLVRAVLAIFRPKRFTMTLFADDHGLSELTGGAAAAFPLCVTAPAAAPSTGADVPPASPVALVDGHAVLNRSSGAGALSAEGEAAAAAANAAVAAAAAREGGAAVAAAAAARRRCRHFCRRRRCCCGAAAAAARGRVRDFFGRHVPARAAAQGHAHGHCCAAHFAAGRRHHF